MRHLHKCQGCRRVIHCRCAYRHRVNYGCGPCRRVGDARAQRAARDLLETLIARPRLWKTPK